jgi:hypothetical protein
MAFIPGPSYNTSAAASQFDYLKDWGNYLSRHRDQTQADKIQAWKFQLQQQAAQRAQEAHKQDMINSRLLEESRRKTIADATWAQEEKRKAAEAIANARMTNDEVLNAMGTSSGSIPIVTGHPSPSWGMQDDAPISEWKQMGVDDLTAAEQRYGQRKVNEADLALAGHFTRREIQNLKNIQERKNKINSDRRAAIAAQDVRKLREVDLEAKQLKLELDQLLFDANKRKGFAEATKAEESAIQSQLKTGADKRKAERERQIKAYKDVAGGFRQFPAAQTMATEEYDEDPYDVRPPTEAEKANARTQLIRLKEADKVGDLEAQQLGLAPVVRGDIQWVNDPNNKQTYAQNVTKTSEWLATIMRGIAEEANDKTDNGLVIPSITENEEKRIINSVVMASVQIARTTGKRVEDIVQLILANKKLYLNDEYKEDKSGFDEYYYDYIPKGYDEIITAFDQKYKHIKDTGRAPITTEAAPQEVPSLDSIAVIMGNGRKITYRELQEEARYQSNVQKRKVSMKEVLEQLKKQDGINQNTILPSTTLPNRLPSG